MNKIYFDTNCFIYYFEGNSQFSEKLEKIFDYHLRQNDDIVSSTLLIAELLTGPIRHNQSQLIDTYSNLISFIPNLDLIPMSTTISHTAAIIRAKYNFRAPDAIHLATAIDTESSIFYTSDQSLAKVTEVKVKII